MRRRGTQAAGAAERNLGQAQLFTLEVSLLSGPVTERFARANPVISRTIEIRGDQTLAALHHAIFGAFDRDDEHLYEFQVGGRRPMDPRARRYGLPAAMDERVAGDVTHTSIGSLGLGMGDRFGYWFDFGDDWWHGIEVLAIDESVPSGRLP